MSRFKENRQPLLDLVFQLNWPHLQLILRSVVVRGVTWGQGVVLKSFIYVSVVISLCCRWC